MPFRNFSWAYCYYASGRADREGIPGRIRVREILRRGWETAAGGDRGLGAKNAALKFVAASLLAPGKTVVHHVPRIKDMHTMLALLDELGSVRALRKHPGDRCPTVDSYTAPYELVRQMRASLVVLGPLAARFGEAEVSAPGGCNLGLRKFNFHVDGLRALGAESSTMAS